MKKSIVVECILRKTYEIEYDFEEACEDEIADILFDVEMDPSILADGETFTVTSQDA